MEPNTQDRLKAFLSRNRTRIIGEKDEPSSTQVMSTPTNVNNQRIYFSEVSPNSFSSRVSIQKSNTVNYGTGTSSLLQPNSEYSTNSAENLNSTQEGLTKHVSSDIKRGKGKRATFLGAESPLTGLQRKTARTPTRLEASQEKKTSSLSPIKDPISPNKNLIENYVNNKKQTGTKLRSNIRRQSVEPKRPTAILKKGFSTIYQTNQHDGSGSSDFIEPQEPRSTRNSASLKTQIKEIKEFKEFKERPQAEKKIDRPQKAQKQVKHPLSTTNKRAKEEKHEYVFEEVPNASLLNRNSPHSRNGSRSKGPRSNSATPKATKEISKIQQAAQIPSGSKNVENKERITPSQDKELFHESSKRLEILDASTNSEAKFKKEIQKLIEIIRTEKEQINKQMDSMNKELTKYKSAYKKLKKRFHQYKQGSEAKFKSLNVNNYENIIVSGDDFDTHGSLQNSPREANINEKKLLNQKKQEENYVPFTIEELNQHLDSNLPVHTEENHIELLSKMDHINLDVENIVMKNTDNNTSNRESVISTNIETHSFHLRRNAINYYIIKEMNLSSSFFFQDPVKEVEEDIDFKPTVIDLLAAQREIIHFLMRKIEIEEKQRLKTEEQASKMIAQMERTIKQLEERGPARKKESASNTELNKSTVSQNL